VPESIKLDNPTPYNLVGQKNYTDRVLEQFKELKDDNVKKEAKIKRMGEKLYVLKVFARQKTLICMLSSVALCFAISHIFAAGAQAYFRTYPLSTEPWAFLQYFTQSILLSLFAMCIAYCYYRRYLYLVRTTDFKSVFAIGWGGIFVAGLLTMIQTPPEVYALLLMNNVKDVSYLNWPVIPFLLISKLGVFPFMGLFGAAIAGVSKIPEIKKA
jgi:Na+/melibiose symporter-like transporter